MKDLLDKILKPKKTKEEATETVVEPIKEEAPYKVEPAVVKVKEPNPWPRPHHHPVCTCHKCIRWKEAENAK